MSRPLDTAGGLVATRLTVTRLVAATHSRGSRTGTSSCSSRGIASRRKAPGLGGVELDGARRIALELDPDRREDRLDQLQAQLERAPGIALAEEREHVVAAVAQEAGRECERRVVRRLEPELEDDGRRLGAAGRRPRPAGGRGSTARASGATSPSSTHVLSRRSSAGYPLWAGSVGLAAASPARKCSAAPRADRPALAGTSTAPRSARRRELVDRTAVEIVDEGVRVAVERVGGRCRRGVGEGRELVAHVLVERRAPERVPPSVGRLEMRVHEAGGDRAACRAQHLEDDPGAPAELDVLGRRVDEAEQLVELEQPRSDAALGEVEVGDRRHPELELAGGELAVGVADERKGARILLPQELEGRRRWPRRTLWEGADTNP